MTPEEIYKVIENYDSTQRRDYLKKLTEAERVGYRKFMNVRRVLASRNANKENKDKYKEYQRVLMTEVRKEDREYDREKQKVYAKRYRDKQKEEIKTIVEKIKNQEMAKSIVNDIINEIPKEAEKKKEEIKTIVEKIKNQEMAKSILKDVINEIPKEAGKKQNRERVAKSRARAKLAKENKEIPEELKKRATRSKKKQ